MSYPYAVFLLIFLRVISGLYSIELIANFGIMNDAKTNDNFWIFLNFVYTYNLFTKAISVSSNYYEINSRTRIGKNACLQKILPLSMLIFYKKL